MIAKEIRDEIIKHVKVGARLRDAAQAVGYTIEQVRAWKREDVVFAKDLRQARIKCKIDQLERLSQAKGWQAPIFLLERKWPKEFGRRRPLPVRERSAVPPGGDEEEVDFSDMTPEEMARLEGCFRKPRLLIDASAAPAQTHGGSSSSESVSETPGEHTTGNEGGAGI